MQITLSDVSYTYPCATTPIINSLSAVFPEGWSGLLGDNGCGKTTLADIIAGKLKPDVGAVTQGLFVCICDQGVENKPDELVEFSLDYGRQAKQLRRVLRIEDDMAWRFDELSFGERKKLQIAVSLWKRPDVLILDEPTNHIDYESRLELTRALQSYTGVGILISHDRELLDALVKRCFSFEDGKLALRPGSYSQAFAQAIQDRNSLEHERRQAKQELARLQAEKDARSREANRASAKSSKRKIDPKDHSAKAKIDLARVSGQDGARGKLSVQMDRRLLDAQKRVDNARVSKRYDGDLWIDAQPHPRKTLLRIDAATIPCGDGQLHIPELFVGNEDHIGVIGANGAGKSTLLAHLRTILAKDIFVLDIHQELSQAERSSLISQAKALSKDEKGQVMSVIAQLNSDPKRLLESALPSPGEARKLALALGIMRKPSMIMMDEPTNHLDLHSIEALERALASYPGALVLVSHDQTFIKACTDTLWEVSNGEVLPITRLSLSK